MVKGQAARTATQVVHTSDDSNAQTARTATQVVHTSDDSNAQTARTVVQVVVVLLADADGPRWGIPWK